MSRMAQARIDYHKQQEDEKKKKPVDTSKPADNRNVASKVFDVLNLLDSGRSFTTATPSDEQKNKSSTDQAKDILGSLFNNTAKTLNTAGEGVQDAVELGRAGIAELTGNKEARDAALDRGNKNFSSDKGSGLLGVGGVLGNEETKKDIPVGELTKKIVGTGAGVVGEILPVGKGAQAGKAVIKEGEEIGSKMARARLAANVGAEGGSIGGLGAAGSVIADDNTDLTTKEGLHKFAGDSLLGVGTGGVLAGGGAASAFRKPLVPDERGSIQAFNSKIGDDLKTQVDNGKIDGNIQTKNADDLQLGSDTASDPLDPLTVEDYKNRIKRGDTLDPLVIKRGSDGLDYVADGAHRLAAAQELGIKDIPTVLQKDNVVMAEKVTPPTVQVLEQPVQMRVLDDVQSEANVRSPGDSTTPAKQVSKTQTQQGAQHIVDDTDRLQKETGIEVDPLDRKAAAVLSGETQRSGWQEFKDKMGRNFQDTLTVAARTTGKPGTDFVYNMLKGNKFKRDALDALREPMSQINSLNKKLSGAGKLTNRQGSLAAKRDVGARLGQALDDRANADQYLKTPDEKALFNHYVTVFDYVKQLREKAGLETLENYRPWVDMKDAAEPPTWLADAITTKKVQTISRFSKERTKTEAGDNVDNNLADMIYGYLNSQLNELAYDAPVKKFKGDLDNLSAGGKAHSAQMNEGVDYLNTLVQQAVNPSRKDPLERVIGKATSNVYGSVLPFNVKLALQNKTQKFIANSRVSKGARKLSGQMDEADLKDLESGLVFGDTTVYGQLEDVNGAGKTKGVADKFKKVDPYQRSEHNNVLTSYHKGVAQAILDSDPYKTAIKSGSSKKDAVKLALQDPQVKESAIRRGNIVVNDTQFGASPLARPQMLREEGTIWGLLPKKTVYMFSRFPIGMSQHILETLNTKNARALELLKNGDPRASSIAEMRTNYDALLSSMKDSKQALNAGKDIGIPSEVLDKQIATVSKNLGIIDKEAKKLSQIRVGKNVKNLGKMWAAATAIQIIFDGGIQSFADDPADTTSEALAKSNPTASGKLLGQNSVLSGVTSAASPVNKYGDVNPRGITNAIPGVGLVVNRGRDIKKLSDSLLGTNEE